jgi:hypothetical protein
MENKLEICPLFIHLLGKQGIMVITDDIEAVINNSSSSFHTIIQIPAFTTHHHSVHIEDPREHW